MMAQVISCVPISPLKWIHYKMKKILIILFGIAVIAGCSKDDETTEELSYEPSIAFVELTPLEIDNFKNSVTLTISYKDNNGDLGFDDPDQYALWVKDSRLDSADWYHIPPLSPVGKSLIIQGKLDIVLNSIFIIGNGNEELMSLSVKIRDRANNWSNIIHTPSITVKK